GVTSALFALSPAFTSYAARNIRVALSTTCATRWLAMTRRDGSPQPLIPGIAGGFAGDFHRGLCRTLAAGNLDRLAPRDFVPGIIGHLPEEPGRYRRDEGDDQKRRGENAGGKLGDMAQHHG